MSDLIDRQREVEHLRKIIEATNPESGYNEGWIDGLEYCITTMSVAPSEIIMCEDCIHSDDKPIADGRYWCAIHGSFMYYCSDAKSRISPSRPEIIKCKDCEHWRLNDYENVETCWHHRNIDGTEQVTNPDDFCSMAKRREDGSN